MLRFETYASALLAGLELRDLGPLLETLTEEELVRLLGGMPAGTETERLHRNVVTTTLENRVSRLKRLLDVTTLPPAERDLGEFTSALARALRVEGACVDEVVGDRELRLHGQFGLPAQIMETEMCDVSTMALCEHVLRTGVTLQVANIANDPRWRTTPAFTRHGLMHFTGAPGYAPDGTLRCVVWVTGHKPRSLNEDELSLVQRLAARLATEFAGPNIPRDVLVGQA